MGQDRRVLPEFSTAEAALGVGVVAHPQGPLAHGILFALGFESSLAIGLGGEGIEVRAHLRMEGRWSAGLEAGGRAPCSPPCCPGLGFLLEK